MRKQLLSIVFAAVASMMAADAAAADGQRSDKVPHNKSQANTIKEMFAELNACVVHAGGPAGSQITFRFSIRRDGSLIGEPMITYAQLTGSQDARRTFVTNALSTLKGCLPLAITSGLGNAIAGRPLAVRLLAGAVRA